MAESSLEQLEPPKFEEKPRLLIVAAHYQVDVVNQLKVGASKVLNQVTDFVMIDVPGALEIPIAIRIAAESEKFDGFVALGCVVRGDTTHYETVCNESARGLTLLGLSGLCIGNGILTVENMEQGLIRSDPEKSNKGGEAALAALHLIALTRRFSYREGKFGFQLDPKQNTSQNLK